MKTSIITVNYNNSEGLQKTIESIIRQSTQDFQYIIIDGGSDDNSTDVINEYAARINYWISEPDKGIYNAMNKGIEKATGEYLLFLNSGDRLHNDDVLSKAEKYLGNYELVYSNLNLITDKGDYLLRYPDVLTFSHFYVSSLPHPATFIKKSLFNKLGHYDESLKICSDWKFFIDAVCRHNCSYLHAPETFSDFFLDGISSQKKNEALIKNEREKVLSELFPAFLPDYVELTRMRTFFNHASSSRLLKILNFAGLIKWFRVENHIEHK
jgi:glycosyltransferase involved in cell wall biosynthesis